jgi:hypothetical protein
MRRPGRGDTLIKIASLGGGGVAIGGNLQKTANRAKRIKEELEKSKREDAMYKDKIKRMKKAAARKRIQKKKGSKCASCGGKGCSKCMSNTGDGTGAAQGKYKGK